MSAHHLTRRLGRDRVDIDREDRENTEPAGSGAATDIEQTPVPRDEATSEDWRRRSRSPRRLPGKRCPVLAGGKMGAGGAQIFGMRYIGLFFELKPQRPG